MTGLLVLAAALLLAAAFGLYRRWSDGRVKEVESLVRVDRLTTGELGTALGSRATLVQFSSAFCAPCRATRVLLADIADTVPGVTHAEVDAEANLDLVRSLNITRTPTVLVLDADGRVRNRAVGLPRRTDLLAALGAVVP
jgi:thiol-disulfide isomerase/thioredoxin